MSDTLIGNSRDKYYQEASILTGRPNFVKVLVEDEEDISFWNDILSSTCPDKDFEITPYASSTEFNVSDLTKGKSHLKKFINRLGSHFIECIDSDLDYVLKEFDEDAEALWKNEYVFQTCAYSRENLLCEPVALKTICFDCTKEKVREIDFSEFLKELSKIVYPVVIWLCFLEKRKIRGEIINAWNKILDKNTILKNNDISELLDNIQKRVVSWISDIESRYQSLYDEKIDFENELRATGLVTPNNGWYFIRGHNLKDYLIKVILKSIVGNLKQKRIEAIKETEVDPKIIQDILNHYLSVCCDPSDLFEYNKEWKKVSPFYPLIQEKIKKVLNKT